MKEKWHIQWGVGPSFGICSLWIDAAHKRKERRTTSTPTPTPTHTQYVYIYDNACRQRRLPSCTRRFAGRKENRILDWEQTNEGNKDTQNRDKM